jgi:hypothetical protein
MSRRVVLFLLCVVFCAAVAARVSTTDPDDNPYFRGSSAMAYRHMIAVAEHRSLDKLDDKAGFPQGYVPARYRAAGAETISGLAYRAVHLVSDADDRDVARGIIVLLASLCVFTAYSAATTLWNSRSAGFLAAFLVAFEPALVAATNGRTFSHAAFAAFFASLYAAVALRSLKNASRTGAAVAALCAFALLSMWEPARYGLLVWIAAASVARNVDRNTRIWFVMAHVVVIIAAVCIYPHLVATRALGAWTTMGALAAGVVALLPEKHRKQGRALAYLVAGAAVLTLLAKPMRAGATEDFPALRYVLMRAQYAFSRPSSSLLSDWMRYLWSADHAPLPLRHLVQLFFPVLLCLVAWVMNAEVRAQRARFLATLALLVLGSTAVIIDRSILPAMPLALIVIVSGAAAGLDVRRWQQSAWVVAGAYTALAGVVLTGRFVDPSYQLTHALHGQTSDPAGFSWISFENTDKELIRFISTHTSVKESILAPDDLSGLLLAFSGRTSATVCGTTSRAAANRYVDLMRNFYRDEDTFYNVCRQQKIDYVLYSVDMLLDTGTYSPVYMTGVSGLTNQAVAARMHFQPEALRHFTLIYENEHYRLYKVTDTTQPLFITDHPLYYQGRLFMESGASFDAFRKRVLWLMGNCATGMGARARGDLDKARQILDQCVRYAPSFTRARLELAYTYMDLGRYEKARDEIAEIIKYAPDNATALYAAAWVRLQMDKPDEAKPFLTLLAQAGDHTWDDKTKALQYYIDHKLPLKPGAPQP